jgi:NTE family protein
VQPPLVDISSGDFHRLGEAVRIGEEAARRAAATLARLSVSAEEYERYRARFPSYRQAFHVDRVRIQNRSGLSPELLRRRLRMRPGGELDTRLLQADLTRIYGLGIFDRVDFWPERRDGESELVIEATEKPWGPTYIRFGLGIRDQFNGDNSYTLGASVLATQLNARAGELRGELQVGNVRRVAAELYQPVDYTGRLFLAPRAEYRDEVLELPAVGEAGAKYLVSTTHVGVDAGVQLSNWGEARIGWARERLSTKEKLGGAEPPARHVWRSVYSASFAYDQLDDAVLPRRGSVVVARLSRARGPEGEYAKASLDVTHALPVGERAILTGVVLGSRFGPTEAPWYDQFTLGGFLRLSGYRERELSGQHLALLRLVGYQRLGVRGIVRVGLSLEAGNAWTRSREISAGDLHYAGSLLATAGTPLGPVYLAYGVGDGGHRSAYLFVGRPF